MRIDRRVSPHQTILWTVAELVTPRRPETQSDHPICEFRVAALGIRIVIERSMIRPPSGRRTSGNIENRREVPRCVFAVQPSVRPASRGSLRRRLFTTSSDSSDRKVRFLPRSSTILDHQTGAHQGDNRHPCRASG